MPAALVERDHIITRMERLLRDCVNGRGGLVVLTGGIASGRTALMNELATWAPAFGARHLGVTGTPSERGLPLGVMDRLLSASQHPAAAAPRPVPVPRRPIGTEADGEPPDSVLDRACESLLDLTGHRPLLIVVDNADDADDASLRCLVRLTEGPQPAPVMLVLGRSFTCRTRPPEPLNALLARPEGIHLRVEPLSPRGVEDLLAADLGPATAGRLAPSYHAVSGGNPLLLRALVEDRRGAAPSGCPGSAPVVGGAFRDAVLTCVTRSEPQVSEVAEAIAVLGSVEPVAVVAQLAGVSPAAVRSAAEVLELSGLLHYGRFRHPQARSAMLSHAPPGTVMRLHQRAAALLHRAGAPVDEVADHLVLAGEPLEQWSSSVLSTAADLALDAHDVETAVNRLRFAYRFCPDDAARAEILAKLAAAQWRLQPSATSRHLPELIAAVRQGHLSALSVTSSLKQLLWHGRLDETVGLLTHPRTASATFAAPGRALRQWLAFFSPPAARRVDEQLSARRADYGSPAAGWAVGFAHRLLRHALRGPVPPAEISGAVRLLDEAGTGDSALETAAVALLGLTCAGELGTATKVLSRLLATPSLAPVWRASFVALRAEVAWRQGEPAEAVRHAEDALTAVQPQGWGVAIGGPLGTMILANTALGRHGDAAACLAVPVPPAMFQTVLGLHYQYARGTHYLATKRPHAALAEFQSCGALMREWDIDAAGLVPWRCEAVTAELRLGRRREARKIAYESFGGRGSGGPRARGLILRAMAATADEPSQRLRLTLDAVDAFTAADDRLHLIRALTELAEEMRAAGEVGQAQRTEQRAQRMAREYGVEIRVPQPQPDRDEPHRAPASVSALSDAERRVATLAAFGFTNREIAETLFVTVSTVEQHLTRIYQKLRITRRTDLPIDADMVSRPLSTHDAS